VTGVLGVEVAMDTAVVVVEETGSVASEVTEGFVEG